MEERRAEQVMRRAQSCRRLGRRILKHWPPVTLAFVFFLVLFGAGFVSFSERIGRMQAVEPLPAADGIIVLTGGRARLETGLELLEKGKGRRLLISGVNPLTQRDSLVRVTHADPRLFECCVDLGHDAMNTSGNAEEGAEWVRQNGYRRVYIVTNSYHMPRALKELERSLPQTKLIPYPVQQNTEKAESWLQFFERLRILMVEYIKFLGVSARNLLA